VLISSVVLADARSDVLTDVEFDAFEVWVGKIWAERGDPPTPEEVRSVSALVLCSSAMR
jgi:hypothetical protein